MKHLTLVLLLLAITTVTAHAQSDTGNHTYAQGALVIQEQGDQLEFSLLQSGFPLHEMAPTHTPYPINSRRFVISRSNCRSLVECTSSGPIWVGEHHVTGNWRQSQHTVRSYVTTEAEPAPHAVFHIEFVRTDGAAFSASASL